MSGFVIGGLNFTTKQYSLTKLYNFDFDFLKDLEDSFPKTSCFLCRMMVILVHVTESSASLIFFQNSKI